MTLRGAANLRNETAVLDDGEILAAERIFQPIPRGEAEVLGIPEKEWTETVGRHSLLVDPLIHDLNGFFRLLERAESVRSLADGQERSTPVRRYAAKVGMEDFLAILPSATEEQGKSGKTSVVQMRDYLENYFVWDQGGQPLDLAVDLQGRIRRADLTVPSEPFSLQLYDYGVIVDVSPPPARRIIGSTDFENLKTEYCNNPIRQTRPRKPPCQ